MNADGACTGGMQNSHGPRSDSALAFNLVHTILAVYRLSIYIHTCIHNTLTHEDLWHCLILVLLLLLETITPSQYILLLMLPISIPVVILEEGTRQV